MVLLCVSVLLACLAGVEVKAISCCSTYKGNVLTERSERACGLWG